VDFGGLVDGDGRPEAFDFGVDPFVGAVEGAAHCCDGLVFFFFFFFFFGREDFWRLRSVGMSFGLGVCATLGEREGERERERERESVCVCGGLWRWTLV
jgi:hypothetical protein